MTISNFDEHWRGVFIQQDHLIICMNFPKFPLLLTVPSPGSRLKSLPCQSLDTGPGDQEDGKCVFFGLAGSCWLMSAAFTTSKAIFNMNGT